MRCGEAVRRRVLLVVALLTAVFLGLYALAAFEAFDSLDQTSGGGIPIDERALTGGTLLGLAMFVALFLGVVLAVFLTLDAVRGDAERGLLQPLVVRPVGRTTLLAGRLLPHVSTERACGSAPVLSVRQALRRGEPTDPARFARGCPPLPVD